jgi:hypothetical protein
MDLMPFGKTIPSYELSGKLFNDTKRIKTIVPMIDVLLTGEIGMAARSPEEVLGEIGLVRQEHPVRLAGHVVVRRKRVSCVLDAPYIGLQADTILGLDEMPSMVMTIENPTTFHSEACRHCLEKILLIYTAGMPNQPWIRMYQRLLNDLPLDTPVFHWGDIDEGGFRIASVIAVAAGDCGRTIMPSPLMHPDSVPEKLRVKAGDDKVERMVRFALKAGWGEIAESIRKTKFTVEQEALG